MDKNAIKKYAVWARRELIERVSQRAMIFGITAKDTGDPNADSVNGHLLSQTEKRQRQALIRNIKDKGYEQVMEEVAYTWFNRFAALRFMEVNGYLPSHVRVFTNDAGEFKPQILAEAIRLEMDGLDMNKVYELANANKNEELFKYLLIVQCNALNSILPGMFQKIEDYTELLLPDYLLREGSVIEQMVTTIPEEDWTDQVQIIGWLYQYYNTEPKDKVFENLKKNIKITKENIPAATQLFTPDWIVHYMVENSLGRLWLEGHPNDALKSEWKYYLDEAEQEPEVEAQLAEIRKEYAALKPEEIKVIDPCMGSGHILCVLFDVLVRIYENYGYTTREAAVKIIENNLWGLDIDERAAQLSYFTVMMKTRQYDRRFFTRNVQPHVYAIEESNGITSAQIHNLGQNLLQEEYAIAVNQTKRLVEEMHDAKEYGSIIRVTPCDWDLLRRFATPREGAGHLYLDVQGEIEASARLQMLINVGETLAQKYDVVVTNPPYMGSSGMGVKLSDYVKNEYPETKSDMSTVFMEKTIEMCSHTGCMAMINIPVWLFISSYEKLRGNVIRNNTLLSMVHPGRGIFGSDFGTTTFVIAKKHIKGYKGSYFRLFMKQGDVETPEVRERAFLERTGANTACQDNFSKIPGSPVAYWASKNVLNAFVNAPALSSFCEPRQGLISGDNNRFLRLWYEVSADNTAFTYNPALKWYPINKGGDFRRWYGNREYVLNWKNNGEEIKSFRDENGKLRSRPQNLDYNFRRSLSWSLVTSGGFSVRYYDEAFTFNVAGISCFPKDEHLLYLNGLLNSKIISTITQMLNPTINMNAGDVAKVPIMMSSEHKKCVEGIVASCISISRDDWDSFETSWDFNEHPFITTSHWAARNGEAITINRAFSDWQRVADGRFHTLRENENQLNRIFIDIYGLGDELTPEVEDKDVTVHRADLQREVRSFISYAVGCMFGRYTLGKPGLIYAGGEWDTSKYQTIIPDTDNIIPICDDEYFDDDIVGRFVKFVEVVYGKETLEENLQFIASALGSKGSPREVIRSYFINDFYADHLKVYQKRPIYWLFDSGKKNGFKCLIYMHRYQPDTIARIRTDYVHEQQSRYRTAIADLEQRINGASTSERVKLSKQLTKLQEQAEELRVYEEKIHHLADQMIKIDLDDGVKHNYELFKDVLAKI